MQEGWGDVGAVDVLAYRMGTRMLREIVIDTETTGLDPANGDRLIELGCIEIVNRIPTGREFHRYLNPERDIHRDAVAVHGLTGEFLKDKPLFKDVADEFLDFIDDAPLVAHNASFDLGFINAELERAARPPLHPQSRRRYPRAGAAPPPGRPQQPRCAVQALRHRHLRAHQARRAARLACCSPTSTSSCWASGRPPWA